MKPSKQDQPTRPETPSAPPAADPSEAPQTDQGSLGGDAELDFESLDLTIEAVDERISPSETNVFDK